MPPRDPAPLHKRSARALAATIGTPRPLPSASRPPRKRAAPVRATAPALTPVPARTQLPRPPETPPPPAPATPPPLKPPKSQTFRPQAKLLKEPAKFHPQTNDPPSRTRPESL